MTKRIIVERGVNKKIAKIFRCSPQYVGQCLYYKTLRGYTDKAIKIRSCAINQFDGKLVQF